MSQLKREQKPTANNGRASTPEQVPVSNLATGPRTARNDERNVRNFRIENATSATTAQLAAQTIPTTPPKASQSQSEHALTRRFRGWLTDVEAMFQQSPHSEEMHDRLVTMLEDGVKDLKKAKADAKRRGSVPRPSGKRSYAAAVSGRRRGASAGGGMSSEPLAREPSPTTPPKNKDGERSVAESPSPQPEQHSAKAQSAEERDQEGVAEEAADAQEATAVEGAAAAAVQRTNSTASKRDELSLRSSEGSAFIERRLGSATRSDERRVEANQRRQLKAADQQQRFGVRDERQHQAKTRREHQAERVRSEASERNERAARNREEQLERKREFASKDTSRADEVTFCQAVSNDTKSLELEERLRQADQQAEQRQQEKQASLEKQRDDREKALERARELEAQRREANEQRISQKDQQTQKIQQQKSEETEVAKSKREDRERRVQDNVREAEAEAAARALRETQRQEQSAQLREEKERKQREKLDREEKKAKEAKERREEHQKLSFHDMMTLTNRSDGAEAANAVWNKMCAVMQRSAKAYVESYQAQHSKQAGNTKVRARAIAARFGTSAAQGRGPLYDLLQLLDSKTDPAEAADHEYLRAAGIIPSIMQCFIDSRKSRPSDMATMKLAFELLLRLLTHPTEGPKHLEYFTRSGQFLAVATLVSEEIRFLKKQNTSFTLHAGLSILQHCSVYLLAEVSDRPNFQASKEVLQSLLDVMDLSSFATSLSAVASMDDEWGALQNALGILRCQLHSATCEDVKRFVDLILTILTNVFTPKGVPLKPDSVLGPSATAVLFSALRILTDLTRQHLLVIRKYLEDGAVAPQFYHPLSAICTYVANHSDQLEQIRCEGVSKATIKEAIGSRQHLSPSFLDAVEYGATVAEPLPIVLPSWMNAGTSGGGKEGGKVAVAPPAAASYLRCAFHEMLLLIGYVTADNPPMQNWFACGTTPLLSQLLACIPISYFGIAKHIVMPTLLCLCANNARNCEITAADFDVKSLQRFLEGEIASYPSKVFKKKTSQLPKSGVNNNDDEEGDDAAAVQPSVPRPVLDKMSWADVVDDDDDDAPFQGLQSQAIQSTQALNTLEPFQPQTSTASVSSAILTKSFSSQTGVKKKTNRTKFDAVLLFRIDRRFPVQFWHSTVDALLPKE